MTESDTTEDGMRRFVRLLFTHAANDTDHRDRGIFAARTTDTQEN